MRLRFCRADASSPFRRRHNKRSKHGRPLLHVLFGGPSCHAKSGFPLADLEKLGCVVEAQTFVGNIVVPVSRLVVEGFDVLETAKRDFCPPRGFTVQRMEPHPPPPIQPVLRR
jgi:hypothetical protein